MRLGYHFIANLIHRDPSINYIPPGPRTNRTDQDGKVFKTIFMGIKSDELRNKPEYDGQ